jgi:hypothetical protein
LSAILPIVIMQNVIMRSVGMLNIIMQCHERIIMLNVIMQCH